MTAAATVGLLVGLVPMFQNCGGVNLRPLGSQSLLTVHENPISGYLCHPLDSALVSPYSLTDFYVLNLTAHKFNGHLEADSNSDGTPDAQQTTRPNPVLLSPLDSDSDGIPDFVETLKGLNPTQSDANQDGIDLDGISNHRELQIGTDPRAKGDEPSTSFTVQPTSPPTDCGHGQPAYFFNVSKLQTVPMAEFSDLLNPTQHSLSHERDENVILIMAVMSPLNASNPSIILSRLLKVNHRTSSPIALLPSDFSKFGEVNSGCTSCPGGGGGNFYLKVYAGKKHACAISTAKKVVCWGDNSYGQLGDGSFLPRLQPVALPVQDTVESLALGTYHTCAITTPGDVVCWGKNGFGQLGLNSAIDSDHPQKVSLPAQATMVGAGENHSCAVLQNGEIWCWGRNGDYQLGDGTTTDSLVPVRSKLPTLQPVVTFPLMSLSIAGNNNCLVGGNGRGFCWGRVNNCVQNSIRSVPTSCSGTTTGTFPSEGIRYGAGTGFLGLVTNGVVNSGIKALANDTGIICWGASINYASNHPICGEHNYQPASITTFEFTLGISNIAKITLGFDHSCAIRRAMKDGALTNYLDCWGGNSLGQIAQDPALGHDNLQPTTLSAISEPLDVASGDRFSCAIDKLGAIWCWGINSYGQLGTGNITNSFQPSKVRGQ